MDPHSRRSQFNQRLPKAGPQLVSARTHRDSSSTSAQKSPSLDNFPRKSAAKSSSMPSADMTLSKSHSPSRSRTASDGSSASATTTYSRPIATNSRVKQNERIRKDMYLAFVNNALQEKAMGRTEHYNELIDQFSLNRPSTKRATPFEDGQSSPVPQLRSWIHALTHVVSRLDRTHSALVEAIVRMPWTVLDASFVNTYSSFIGILVTARPEYLSLVLTRIAQGFTYQSGLQALQAALPESSSEPLTRRIVYDRVHALLRHLLDVVPTVPNTLQPLLARHFPHKRLPKASHIVYIRNMLQVTEYCPELSDKLLATIVDRTLQIDVEIQVELEELEAAQASSEQPDLFELDPFDTVVGQEGEDDSDSDGSEDGFSDISSEAQSDGEDDDKPAAASQAMDVDHITDMVGKLDAVLTLLFEHFSSVATSTSDDNDDGNEEEEEEAREARMHAQFHTLLTIFDRSILRTFKSRHTQFLVFWYSARSPVFADTFLGALVGTALLGDGAAPTVTRAAAAGYVGSYVSRATFVDGEHARRVVRVLCGFVNAQLQVLEVSGQQHPSAAGVGAPLQVVYAVVQALFLIFCFRWRDLIDGNQHAGRTGLEQEEEEEDEDEDDGGMTKKRTWMPELDVIPRLLCSSLAPLQVCSETVVMQFARVARATGFAYVYPHLAAARRRPHDAASSVGGGARARAQLLGELGTFFPFDPYRLPRSAKYVEGVYREWASVAIGDDDDDDDDDEDDDEDEDEEDEEDGMKGLARDEEEEEEEGGGLGESFGGMSISPAVPTTMAQRVAVG